MDIIICPYCKKEMRLNVFKTERNSYKNIEKSKCKKCHFKNKDRKCKECYNTEISEGLLQCGCGRWYPIINKIPRILSDSLMEKYLSEKWAKFLEKYKEAIPNEISQKKKDIHKEAKIKTLEGFGYEWKNFSKLFDTYEKQFLDWIYPIKPKFFVNKLILDAGCGAGRHSYHSAKFGAEVVGFDLSESVDVAYNNTKIFPKTYILQADIYHLPFRESQFDYVYSIGVLHHLPTPQEGFDRLVNILKKGGAISVWVYGKEGNYLLKIMDPLRKHIICKLPVKITNKLSYIAMLFIYPIIKFVYKPLNKKRFTKKIADKILPQNSFFNYLANFNFEQNHSILFDQLLAPIANYYKKEEFEKWFLEAPLKDIKITRRNKNSWRGLAIKNVNDKRV